MTTNQTHIPEPTPLTAVVMGKHKGKAAVAMKVGGHGVYPWFLRGEDGSFVSWSDWDDLCDGLTDIRVVPVSDLAAKPEPGPWLLGDELAAILPTLKAGDVVEVEHDGHKVTGGLWVGGHGFLALWAHTIRTTTGKPGPYIDALRIVERAPEPEPEPGADIPDAVVKAAANAINAVEIGQMGHREIQLEFARAALAAADAKRAELEGQA